MAKIKLVKQKSSEELKKEQKKDKIKANILKWIKNLILFLGLIIFILFGVYQFFHYTKGFTIYFQNYSLENEYGRFLIEINDKFIENMISFDDTSSEGKDFSEYTDFDKEKLSNIIIAEGNLISRLENTAPSDKNLDYKELYQNMLESYALYIQGQVMKMDYIYQTQEGMDSERFTLGDSLTTLIGNFIIEYNVLVNNVRNTDYDFTYSVADGFDIKTGDFLQTPVEYDEDGNLILDEEQNYLFLPEGFEEESTLDEDIDSINQYINNYFNIKEDLN